MAFSSIHHDPNLAPGAHIEIRDEAWRIVRVDTTSNGTKALRVVGLSELVRDKEAIFLTEYERSIRILDPAQTRIVPDTTPGFSLSRLHIESALRRRTPTEAILHVGHRAAMDTLPFQLAPTLRALRSPRPRVLIADAVGLGKTLSAGILLSELIARGRGKRILVVCIKSMLTQLQKELWTRFSIGLVRLDSVGLQRVRAHIPTYHNPFHHFDRSIISIDTLKQDNAFRTYLTQAHWDAIVIDEAHNVAHRGGSRSLRAELADLLATRSDALIMLSATPHDGTARSFASLMNMLDPTAIADPNDYTAKDVEHLFVRRFKKDVREQLTKALPERDDQPLFAQASQAEEDAFSALDALTLKTSSHLFKISLDKALLSSPHACAATVQRRVDTLQRKLAKPTHKTTPADLQHDLEALRAFLKVLKPLQNDLTLFSKYNLLLSTLRDSVGFSSSRPSKRVVLFTERIDTMNALAVALSKDLSLSLAPNHPSEKDALSCQVLRLAGNMSDVDQQRVVDAFGRDRAKVRILVASDVASEGINLHYLSHHLVHFDIPWSLMVFQQRNGRVDRYGQTETPIIRYLLTESANPRIQADNHVLALLIKKDQEVQKNIGDPQSITGATVKEQEATTAAAIQRAQSSENPSHASDLLELAPDTDDPMADLFGSSDDSDLFDLDDLGDFDLFSDDLDDLDDLAATTDPSQSPDQDPSDLLSAVDPLNISFADLNTVTQSSTPSLFGSDYDYLRAGLAWYRSNVAPLDVSFDDEAQRVSFMLPRSLKRRLARVVAREALPEDDRLLLCADIARVQEDLREARKSEAAWPSLHYLWPLHPAMDWLSDSLSGALGRHTAPLLFSPKGLTASQTLLITSAMIPNRRSQPVFHRWYALLFSGTTLTSSQPFEDALSIYPFFTENLVNADRSDEDLQRAADSVSALLPTAVHTTKDLIRVVHKNEHDRFTKDLQNHAQRLQELQEKKLAALGQRNLFEDRHQREEARIRRVFDEHTAWVQDTIKTEPEPFIQIIAAIQGT